MIKLSSINITENGRLSNCLLGSGYICDKIIKKCDSNYKLKICLTRNVSLYMLSMCCILDMMYVKYSHIHG